MTKLENAVKDTQKGIIGFEYVGYEEVLDARYGTFGYFKELIQKNNALSIEKTGKPFFKKNLEFGMMDSWEGINYWIIARGYRNNADLTFYYFRKDGGQIVVPNSKLSEYAKRYEPFLKKRK